MAQHHAVVLEIARGSVLDVYQTGRIELVYLDVDELRGNQELLAQKWSEINGLPDKVREHARRVLIDLHIELVDCRFCHQPTPAHTAHSYQGGWVGDDCCWEERLRSSQ